MSEVRVYNPHDGLSTVTYQGTDFRVEPNTVTVVEVPEHLKGTSARTIAEHMVKVAGMWGLCILSGDPALDAAAKKLAEKRYSDSMRKWSEEQVMAYEADMKPRREAGLRDLDPSEDVSKAKRWLEKRGFIKGK